MSEEEAGRDNGYANGVLGFIFLIATLAILIVIFVYKAYKTTFQRLILYYIVIGLFCELTFALQIVLNFNHEDWICLPIIYFYLYFPLACHVYIAVVTNCSFLLVLHLLRGKRYWHGGAKYVESFCVLLTIALPMAIIWLPIHDGSFAALNCNNSEQDSALKTWNRDSIIYNLMVLITCANVIFICIIFCCIFCLVRHRIRNQRLTALLKKLLYYTGINGTMMGINLLSVTYCFYRSRIHPSRLLSDTVYIVLGILLPVIIFTSVVFQALLSIQTAKNWSSSSSSHDREADEAHTNPASSPLSQPSRTYFSAPYTGAFTQIPSSNYDIISIEGEQSPLMK